MFLVYCDECRQQWLQSVHSVRRVHNLASGVMAVELDGYCGHRLAVMTGRATDEHPDRRPAPATSAPAPSPQAAAAEQGQASTSEQRR